MVGDEAKHRVPSLDVDAGEVGDPQFLPVVCLLDGEDDVARWLAIVLPDVDVGVGAPALEDAFSPPLLGAVDGKVPGAPLVLEDGVEGAPVVRVGAVVPPGRRVADAEDGRFGRLDGHLVGGRPAELCVEGCLERPQSGEREAALAVLREDVREHLADETATPVLRGRRDAGDAANEHRAPANVCIEPVVATDR